MTAWIRGGVIIEHRSHFVMICRVYIFINTVSCQFYLEEHKNLYISGKCYAKPIYFRFRCGYFRFLLSYCILLQRFGD